MKDKATYPYYALLFVTGVCLWLAIGCRSIPCTSVEALEASYDVFLEDHFEYVDRDESLSDDAKAIIHRHALGHKELIEELAKLCAEENE